ncbi:MAG: ABC transporter permease subunit [Bacteroidetes bacterium]|nr:ABC transporter permease subunit [Bacteroidota bacterium]MBS1930886.1 ABC transporter permease subunit [Bacteroidota bacterium]
MKKITKYVLTDILRNKIIIGYTIFLLLISLSLFNLEDSASKGLLSLLNIILIIVPLVSVIFSTIYIYNSAEFIELLVSQPLRRKQLWSSLFIGLAGSLALSFLIGIGIPVIIYAATDTGYILILMGTLLTVIFVAIAMFAAVFTRDKAKGIGLSIFLWLYFSLLFDGLVLFVLFQFQDYPLEKFMIIASAFNPIDLSRIMVLLKMDTSALMGYTGAVFRDFFGTNTGFIIAIAILTGWVVSVFWLSLRKFNRKDM